MTRFSVVPAAYLVLTQQGVTGTEVLLQQRGATGYMEGWWACGAAGHIEAGERADEAVCREAVEELGLTIVPSDVRLAAVLQRSCPLGGPIEQRIDLFFTTSGVAGEPTITEPDKAADLRWWPLSDLPDHVVPHEQQVLEHLRDHLARPPALPHDTTAYAASGPHLLTRGFAQTLTLVAAVGRNGVIGDGAAMPWHLPEDLAFFKRTTMGGVMVMGRGTWDSIGRALPGRRTIVVTRDRGWSAPGAEVAHSLPEALLIAGDTEVFVVGGGQIYEQTMEAAARLVITEVEQEPEGSVQFPIIDSLLWREESRDVQDGFAWVEYLRR
ncbi:dihydrofolate reductase [Ornithinimicrobium cryptoxanthini]|uniref:dihydrofolate reductase n=1 Tax=Ornithinimicrobium cryptoxanthini TaxID=2934161 RepID=A0ABY4YF59_9MICO|nr:dihydrofolate reductase [Ornithinimicrobium cryptoxanthini]USQ75399.1 dihydrofolate reductase [Ornithinimicrobium cryptoxanthini]